MSRQSRFEPPANEVKYGYRCIFIARCVCLSEGRGHVTGGRAHGATLTVSQVSDGVLPRLHASGIRTRSLYTSIPEDQLILYTQIRMSKEQKEGDQVMCNVDPQAIPVLPGASPRTRPPILTRVSKEASKVFRRWIVMLIR